MVSKSILALAAAAAILPASVALTTPVQAQGRYVQSYTERGDYAYSPYRSRTQYDEQGVPGRSAGVGVGSEACSDPAYQMDPRCYSNR